MAVVEVKCVKCGSMSVIKHGKSKIGKQRYYCKSCKGSFLLNYSYNGCKPGIAKTIIKMTANASGIRDISHVLEISTDTVIKVLKIRNLQ